MISVVNANGEVFGYIIDDLFIEINMINSLTNGVDFNTERIYGIFVKSNILTSNGLYYNSSYLLSISNYVEFLSILRNSGLILNDILFIPCELSDIANSNISELWKLLDNLDTKTFLYICIDSKTLNIVAYLAVLDNIFISSCVHICMLECINRNNHIGTRVVNQLKSLDKSVTGLSFVSAIDFWKKQGAVFNQNNYFMI